MPVVKQVEFPAIEGLNFKSFQQISVEERVKMIPASLFEEILLPNEILSISHEHPLVKIQEDGFVCDRIKGLSHCLTPDKDRESRIRYACQCCNFDICGKCMQADFFMSLYDSLRVPIKMNISDFLMYCRVRMMSAIEFASDQHKEKGYAIKDAG